MSDEILARARVHLCVCVCVCVTLQISVLKCNSFILPACLTLAKSKMAGLRQVVVMLYRALVYSLLRVDIDCPDGVYMML